MSVLLTDRRLSPELAEWAAARMNHVGDVGFGPCWAVGIALRGKLAAVVVYSEFQPRCGTVQVSLASDTPRWANRHTLGRVLGLAFEQNWGREAVRIEKVWTSTPSTLPRVVEFNVGIGFTREAVLRHHYGRGKHAIITSMMRTEYAKLYRSEYAKLYRSKRAKPGLVRNDPADVRAGDAKADRELIHV